LQIQTLHGEQQFFSYNYPSPDFGVQYTKYLFGPFSTTLGAHFTVDMIGEGWQVLDNEFLEKRTSDKDFYFRDITSLDAVYYFPVFLNVQLYKRNNFLFTSSMGVKLNYFFSTDLTSGYTKTDKYNDTIEYRIFEMRLKTIENEEKTWFTSYCIKLGTSYIFKNLNMLSCNLQFNYTPINLKEGVFAFSYISNPSSGTVQQRNNYMGLEFVYSIGKKRTLKSGNFTIF
jgi:hypothetical protein